MKQYRVTVTLLSKPKFTIEAESEQDAIKIVDAYEIGKIEEAAWVQGSIEILGTEAELKQNQ